MIALIAAPNYDAINAIVLGCQMVANLVVRNVDEEVAAALKRLATAHERSMEAEHRAILRAALATPKRRAFVDVLASMPDVGDDADFERSRG
ncbi:MAG: hypothetical protein JO171_16430 [Paludibacterium sp.]|uniref:FitA-like ribbon-helix-helix domain-containing protein n=1 Tax=Paludibacterium sp. TaxID=1917523 RepID=UPI0025EC2ABA|nr:hypothetical protein [Paludibacterium sp.]MBV8048737.1 hypothetical protein [Paludibacterium sp.]MBV8649097.1 hypothetical protein [Paludibacterium sp.]